MSDTHSDILRVEVIGVGAIVIVDLIERLFGLANNDAGVVLAVTVPTNHLLTQG